MGYTKEQKDVCDVLGLTTPARVAERLDGDVVSQAHLTDSLGRTQSTTIIRETMMWLREPYHFKQYEAWYEKRYGVPLK